MNLLLTLAAFAAFAPSAPAPATAAGQEIQITKSFELGALAESFTLVSAEYTFDNNQQRGSGGGYLTLKLEAKKDVDQALLRSNAAGFFDDENTLVYASTVRPSIAFPLQKGERLTLTIPTGTEDRKWHRIAIRKVETPITPSSFERATMTAPAVRGRQGGGFGGGGGTIPPGTDPPPNPFDR